MKPIRMTRAGIVLALGLLLAVAFFLWRQARSVDPLRVYTVGWAALPPLEVVGSDGNPTGLAVELVREAARRRRIRLRWVFQEVDPDTALRSGAVDLWPVLTITAERQKAIHVSDPFLETDHCLLVRADSPYRKTQDLAGATIGTSNSLIDGPALRRNFPGARVSTRASVRVLVEEVCQGSADAAYMNEYSAVAALLDSICSGKALRWIAVPQERSQLGIGATFEAAAVADAIRGEIASATGQRWLSPIAGQWGYMSSTVQSIGDLLDAKKRELRLAAVALLFSLLLVAEVFQTVRIRGQRNRTQEAERALREAEQTLRLMADNLHETLVAFDMDRRLTYANPEFEKLTSHATASLTRQIWCAETLFPSADAETQLKIKDHWEAAFQGGATQDREYRLYAPDGAEKWLSASWGPIFDDSGKQTGVQCTGRDITTRKMVEEELFETSVRLGTLLSSSPLAVVEWMPDHRIANWFGGAQQLFGWSAKEAIGRSVEDLRLVCEDDWPKVLYARQLMEDGRPGVSRNRNYRKDGSVVHCEWYNSVLPVTKGSRPVGFSLVLDITSRKEAEEALRVSEEKYRKIVDAAPVGILHTTPAGRVLSANPKLASMFGYDSAEQMMQEVTDTPSLFANPEARHDIVGHAERSQGFVRRETVYKHRNGSHFVANLWIRAERDNHGEVAFLEAFVEDITERKRAEEALHEAYGELERRVAERTAELSAANQRLQELDRLKSQFLASMSHELRTPLNSIIGFTSLLRQGLTGPVNPEQTKQLGIVQGSASHLLTLINDLLDVSRIEAGRADLEHASFDFVDVLGDVLRILKPMADVKGLEVTAEAHSPAIPMTGDKKRTLQVLLNLANNAIKFTEKGRVTISAVIVGDLLRVAVADTGIGIKAEHVGLLFEAFRQVDGSAKRIYEGTGLGLYLCRKLLGLMGGEISVKSVYGAGSCFTYTMPVELPTESIPCA